MDINYTHRSYTIHSITSLHGWPQDICSKPTTVETPFKFNKNVRQRYVYKWNRCRINRMVKGKQKQCILKSTTSVLDTCKQSNFTTYYTDTKNTTGKDKIKAINIYPVPILTFSFGLIKWNDTDLDWLNTLTRTTCYNTNTKCTIYIFPLRDSH